MNKKQTFINPRNESSFSEEPKISADDEHQSQIGSIRMRSIEAKKVETSFENNNDILKNTPEALFKLDQDWKFIYVNHGTELLLDRTAETLLGKSIWQEFPPAIGTNFEKFYRQVMDERVEARIVEYYPVRKCWYEISGFPVSDGITVYCKNVTEQKTAEDRLKNSEKQYRTLFNSIDEGFCIIKVLFDENNKAVDYEFIEINKTFEEQTGLKNTVGKRMRELVPEHEEFWFETYGKIALTGESMRFDHEAAALGRWYDVYAFCPDEVDCSKIAVLFKDVTESKKAMFDLIERERLAKFNAEVNHSLIENTSLTEALKSCTETIVKYLDAAFARIWTFDKGEDVLVLQASSGIYKHLDGGHSRIKVGEFKIGQIAAERKPHLTNKVVGDPRVSNQEWVKAEEIVSFAGYPLIVEDRLIGVVAMFSGQVLSQAMFEAMASIADTIALGIERKRAEFELAQILEQLEAQRARLNYLFTEAPAFVATLNGEDHVFELTNPAYMKLIGHRDVIGKPIREALADIRDQGYFELLDNVYQTGKPFIGREMSVEFQSEQNEPFEKRFVDFVFQPIFENDKKVSGIFIHGLDITEQVESRRQAEDANRLKDEFLATLSHELRTPLNAIIGWSQILKSRDLGEVERERAIATIDRSARAQNQLIDDILDVSRIITGKLRLDVQAVDLIKVISAAVDAVRPAAEAKSIKLQLLLDPKATAISGDPDRLQQVIWNLLSNAVKFTPKTGRVQVRLERVNSHIEIVVSDTGSGIEAEFLPHVFDRFRQSDGSTTRRQGGLGLGLAIVRQIVELHGGTVAVESEGTDKGAKFTVIFPLLPLRSEASGETPRFHPEAESGDVAEIYATIELNDLRVLVVDDETDSREMLKHLLESKKAIVTTAASAAVAFEIINHEKFDILISDIGMPGEDGFSLIRKIRKIPFEQTGKLPAIALTAYARAEDRINAIQSGFQMHIAKPVNHAELIAIIANLTDRMKT